MTDFVFLHGGGQGGWVWDETIAALEQQAGRGAHRYLALDGPGCGAKRAVDAASYDFSAVTAELVGDIVAAGLHDVVLVGHSQAGLHMPAMVALRRDLFRHLVFVSCSAPDPGLTTVEMTGERMHKHGHPFLNTALSMRDRYAAMFCNDMTAQQAEAFLDRLGFDQWPTSCYSQRDWAYDHLAQVPSSYVLCLQDAILPPIWQERFAERFHARRTVRLDCGHQAMNTRPQALAEILDLEIA